MHGPLLAFLTLLFFLRVLGQALVAFFGVPWLPPMGEWFSGLIPYPILLVIQLIMLVGMIKISADLRRGRGFFAAPRQAWSKFLIGFSAIYAGAMIVRYVLTMILHPETRWLGGVIPIFFHFVLAGFFYVWGRYHAPRTIFARPESAC
jgi:uncharacterized protein